MLTASINIAPLLGKLQKLGIVTKQPMQQLVREQARLFVSSAGNVPGMVQVTPPFSKGLTAAKARKQGEGAILRDLLGGKNVSGTSSFRGVFFVMSDSLIAKAVQYHSSGNVRLFVQQGGSGTVIGCDRMFFRPNASVTEMRAHHLEYFKNGRMSQAGGRTRDVGRWKFIDQMVVSASAFRRYFNYIKEHVGILGSGFNAAAAALGAKGVPEWILRHGTKYSGFSVQEGPNSFYITMSDNVPFGRAETVDRMRYVLGYRDAALRRSMPHIIRNAIKKAGFATTAAVAS